MSVKIEYTILAAFVGLVYLILTKFLPEFPISPEMLLTLFVYVLVKLGVEIIGKPALRALFPKRFMGTRHVTPE